MIRRRSHLAAVAAVLVALAGGATPAQSDGPAPVQVPPDLRQKLPSAVSVQQVSDGSWHLGFASEVANDGPGYLKITGNGPGDETMVADQIVQMSDGTTTTVPAVGAMHYVRANHNHWHLLDFERYELRKPSDPQTTIVKDQKTGFCLANAFTSDICGRDHPEYTTVSEGIAAGGSDKYLGYLEGQYIVVDPASTPDGDYLLVNRVNPTGALVDADSSDDAASLRLQLTWTAGQPSITITNSCTAAIYCPAPPPKPQPDPSPQPVASPPPAGQQTTADTVAPAPDPQPVPIVTPPEPAPVTSATSMSRAMAGRLVRRAIQKSTRTTPRNVRTSCRRQSLLTFKCDSTWQGAGGARWSGRVRVWYRESAGQLRWFYDLTARRPGGKRLVSRSVRGSASSSLFSGGGAFLCGRID